MQVREAGTAMVPWWLANTRGHPQHTNWSRAQTSKKYSVLLLALVLQVAADPLAAAFGGRDDVVVLLARLFARGAGCLTEPVGLLQQAGNLFPRFARGRRTPRWPFVLSCKAGQVMQKPTL